MDTTVTASIISVIGSLSGAALGSWLQRDANRMRALERKVLRYKAEIQARQATEQIACQWLVKLDQASSEKAALLALRKKTEQELGLRPRLSPSDLRD